jgi:hypothetical protein
MPALLLAEEKGGFAIRRDPGDKGILFHHRRQLEDGQLLFLVNTSSEFVSAGIVETVARGIERWDPETGRSTAYSFEIAESMDRARFELPPSGSLLLFLSNSYVDPAKLNGEKVSLVKGGALEIRRDAPNVLVLDYVDVRAGGDERKDSYFYQASQFAFQKNGMERNPWDSAVQFRDELISKKFPPESGFEAAFHFTIRDHVPAPLTLVVERPDLHAVACNGKPVTALKDSWWLDRAFGKLDISAAAQVGENLVTLKASPFSIYHELEPVYILGDFRLEPLDKGFAIAPEQALKPGAWNEQGLPFYGGGVSYTQTFLLAKPSGQYKISLRKWYGSVARVQINGKEAGFVYAPPYELDVTRWIKPGSNQVEVVVIGTLKNTLGPHHGEPAPGSAWPAMFQKGPFPGPPPGAKYSTVGYGLMLPFALVQSTR